MCLSPLEHRQFQKTPPRQKIDGKFWATVRDSLMLALYFKTCSTTNYSHWFNSNIDVFWKFQFNTNVFCPFSLWNISDFSQIWLLYTHTFVLFYLIFEIMVSIYEYWKTNESNIIDKTWSYANMECRQVCRYCLGEISYGTRYLTLENLIHNVFCHILIQKKVT